jgi:hypothetical protein
MKWLLAGIGFGIGACATVLVALAILVFLDEWSSRRP